MIPSFRLSLIVLLVLVVLTELTFSDALRLGELSPNLLTNPEFSENLDGWRTNLLQRGGSLSEGVALLRNQDGGRSYLQQQVTLPEGSGWVRLRLELMTEQVLAGAEAWQQARINLLQYDADNHLIDHASALHALLQGDHAWHRTSRVYRLHPQARRVSLLATLNGAQGTLGLRATELLPLGESALFSPLYYLTFGLWLIAGLSVVGWLLLHPPRLARLSLLIIALTSQYLLLGPTSQPDSITRQGLALVGNLQQSAIEQIRHAPEPHDTAGSTPVHAPLARLLPSDKLGHVLIFGLLTLGAIWARGSYSLARIGLVLAGYAVIAEQLQRYTLQRGPDLWDIAYNLLGVVLVLLPVLLRSLLRRPTSDADSP